MQLEFVLGLVVRHLAPELTAGLTGNEIINLNGLTGLQKGTLVIGKLMLAELHRDTSLEVAHLIHAHIGTACGTGQIRQMSLHTVGLAGLSDKPVQSLKPYIGHTLGASGVVETVFCIRQLLLGEVWGTPGFASLGVPVPLSVSSMTRQVRMRHCIKTASGFGGCNAAIVLSLPEHARDMEEKPLPGFRKLKDVKMCGAGDFHSFIREKYKALGLNDMKFYKMDDMSKLGYIASHLLLDGLSFSPEDMAVILQNRSASLDSDLKHLRNITEGPGASPAVFVYTLPNVASHSSQLSELTPITRC